MAKKRRSFSLEFKQEAVRLVVEQGLGITQVGRDLGVDRTVVRDWVRKAGEGELGGVASGSGSPSSLEEEVRRLRKENAILREEREILKKATAFFAKETR